MRTPHEHIVILGRFTPPIESWWTAADLPRRLTRYVEITHLARMQGSKFSALDLSGGSRRAAAVAQEDE